MRHLCTRNIHEIVIADQRELMHYLHMEHGEGREGTELLPLLKAKLGSSLRSQVQSVRYRAPELIVMVEKALEPEDLRITGPETGEPGSMHPVCIRSMHLDESQLSASGHFGLTDALLNICTEPDVAIALGLMWPADTDNSKSLLKQIESLEIQLESSQEINTLLIDLAKTLAEEKGEQLQELVIEKATAAILSESAASQLAASTDDDVADLLDSTLGGVVEEDIYCEIYEQITQLHPVDRLALCLCEPDEVLENWVESQYGEFPTPISCTDIKLSCDTLIRKMARAVEGRIHEAVEA
jgi:hypothetical protein